VTPSSAGWARSGLAWLTGPADGAPDFSRSAVLTRAEDVAEGIAGALGVGVDPVAVLTGRAGLLGLRRQGGVSAGGATRLLQTRDGWCALTLSRPDDVAAVPALVETDAPADDPWSVLPRWAAQRCNAELVERAMLLDLPVAALGETTPAPVRITAAGTCAPGRSVAGLLVADLSSMWAGPLCGAILASAGATVVKVESPSRPDGTRAGDPTFFSWINHGKLSYAVDFDSDAESLRGLLSVADIVIEGSRPAALRRRGLGPGDIGGPPGRIWLRVTGHGADPGRVAFGDDAAVAGGLVGGSAEGPVFCGDAIADPLTGLESARAVADSLRRGGGEVVEVAMAEVAAGYAALPTGGSRSRGEVRAPQPPPRTPPAPDLGSGNADVNALVAQRQSVPC